MAGKLIIIEAGDGCGKATQTQKLYERLRQEYPNVKKIEFPNYKSPSSALIKMYLNGDFGSHPEDVNPYAASAFYAVDRYASFKTEWEDFYRHDGIIIADRYTTSNMVHQAVKFGDEPKKMAFLAWLWDFEFNLFRLPVPDCVIFLDMPPEYSRTLMNGRANKSGAEQDIHEQDQAYLTKCYHNYKLLAGKYHWQTISCVRNSILKTVDEIGQEVYKTVKQTLK
jgi:dTMP kinase